MANDERRDAEALVLWFIAVCSGVGSSGNAQGDVGDTIVGGIKVFAVAVTLCGVGV